MFNEEFDFLDDISEHANLPKVSINSPNLFDKKTSIFNFNENTVKNGYNTVEKKKNINNRKFLNDNLKLTIKIEESDIHKNQHYYKINDSNIIYSNKNNLTHLQMLNAHKKLNHKIIKKSPKLDNNFRNTIENGEHSLYIKKVLYNGNNNTNLKGKTKNNSTTLAPKIIIKKGFKLNRKEINKNLNKDNSFNNNFCSLDDKTFNINNIVNISDNNSKKKDLTSSHNPKLRAKIKTINQSLDFNIINNGNNKLIIQNEQKKINNLNNIEKNLSINKKSNLSKSTRINSIKFFHSNSSQFLFNKEKKNKEDNYKKTCAEKINLQLKEIEYNTKNEMEMKKVFTYSELNEYNNDSISKINNSIENQKNILNKCRMNIKELRKIEKVLIKSAYFQRSEIIKINCNYNLNKLYNSNSKQNIRKSSCDKDKNGKDKNENGKKIDNKIKNTNDNTGRKMYFRGRIRSSRRLTLPSSKKLLINLDQNLTEGNEILKEKIEEISNLNENLNEKNLKFDDNDKNKDNKNIFKKEETLKDLEQNTNVELQLKSSENTNSNNNVSMNCELQINNIINNNNNNIEINNKKMNSTKTILNHRKLFLKNFKSHYSLSKAGRDESGNSKTNQDAYFVLTCINGVKEFNIFGVLDGHGPEGHLVSHFISKYIQEEFYNNSEIVKIKDIKQIYSKLCFKNFELIKKIFLNADNALRNEDIDSKKSGTTCTLVIQIGEYIICANVGDSRAILVCDKENDINLNHLEVFPLSFDNKPENPDERERIIRMGGEVRKIMNRHKKGVGPYRVWVKNKDYPGLAMSRSLGDFDGKKVGIIADPEIIECKIKVHCKFIAICSDGVWEFLKNEDVMNLGKKHFLDNNPRDFCKELIEKSVEFWKREDVAIDDITVVIVFF